MQTIEIVTNKSKLFFTPLFNEVVPISYFNLLRNTYFWYDDFKEETFCLLFKFDGRIKGKFHSRTGFTVYENQLFEHKLFRGYLDYGKYVIYEFELTDDLLDYRNLLIEGKYSKFPEKIKQIIIEFNRQVYGEVDSEHVRRILYKDKELIQEIADDLGVSADLVPECMSGIDPQRELFANSLIEREDEIKRISKTSKKD